MCASTSTKRCIWQPALLLCAHWALADGSKTIQVQELPGRVKESWWCHQLDCPQFTLLRTEGDDLELRSYSESIWVSTNVSELHMDAAVRFAFLKLFEYISGANEHGWRIDMTTPVRTLLIAGDGPTCEAQFKVSFYMPLEYQEGRKKPPAPNRDSLFIETTPAQHYWVYSYPGFTSEDKVLDKATALLERLDRMEEPYTADTFYSSGYDPPFRLINRHNEIWVQTTSGRKMDGDDEPAAEGDAGHAADTEQGAGVEDAAAGDNAAPGEAAAQTAGGSGAEGKTSVA